MSAMYCELYPDPTVMWPWLLASTGSTHEAFASPEFDKIITEYQQSMTKSQEERTKIAQSGEDYIYNNYMFAPIALRREDACSGPQS